MVQVPCTSPSAGVPPAPKRWMEAVALETAPAPLTETLGPKLLAVANSWATRFPLPSRRSILPGSLTV